MKIINLISYKRETGAFNNEPSLFEPDQTMSIREIMERYARGLPIADQKTPIYLDEEEFPDLRKFDLVEIEEMKAKAAEKVETYRKTLREISNEYKTKVREQIKDKEKVQDEE